MLGVYHAIGAAFAGHPPACVSAFFGRKSRDAVTVGEFPHDVIYLTPQALADIGNWTKGSAVWTPERLAAYQSEDMIQRRAAYSAFLWARYQEFPKMTLPLLKLWADVEYYEAGLTPQAWFKQQHPGLSDAEMLTAWRAQLGKTAAILEEKHRATLKQIHAML